jgi:hypothetical protein
MFLGWSVTESGVYLIAACLPCYRPLLSVLGICDIQGSTRSPRNSNLKSASASSSLPIKKSHSPFKMLDTQDAFEMHIANETSQVRRASDEGQAVEAESIV